MTNKEVVEIAKKLTLENMEQLIHIFSSNIDIYFGSSKKVQFGGSLSRELPVCLNGAEIQLNSEYTDKNNPLKKQYGKYLK